MSSSETEKIWMMKDKVFDSGITDDNPIPYKNKEVFLKDLKELYKKDYEIVLTDCQVRTIANEHDSLLLNFL